MINGLGIGTYNLLITDALNCTLSLSANLTIAPDPIVTISIINNVSCNGGSDGALLATITQGTAPFLINWTPTGGNNLTAISLTADTYTVNVTDALGCLTSDTAIIIEPTQIDVSVDTVINVFCYGGNTGSVSVSATGGTGPAYSYLWAPTNSTSATAVDLTIGTYTVTVTDQNNCPASISVNVEQPPQFSSIIDSIFYPVCYDGKEVSLCLPREVSCPIVIHGLPPATR